MRLTFYNSINLKIIPSYILTVGSALIVLMSLSSCFTGVESTKKITLSKDDRKALLPTPEESFMAGITGLPLGDWEKGRLFMASDNKSVLIFEQTGLPPDPDKTALKGTLLSYVDTETRMTPDGGSSIVINFATPEGQVFKYNTGKKRDDAMRNVTSDRIPMLIDLNMVEETKGALIGKLLWTRSPLWYDSNGQRIDGRKYVPVTVDEVEPGNLSFPLRLKFHDNTGKTAWVFMNFGNSAADSRSFSNLFYLSDLREKYPSVSDEVWNLICLGKVRIGMTKIECKLSLGNPSELDAGHDWSQTLDLWHYPDGTALWFEDGILTQFHH